jgi:type I restriction enzyme, S subunit
MMATMNGNGENGRSLPDGWEWSTLGESCYVVLGQSPSSDTYNAGGVGLPFYQGKTEFGDLYPTPEKWCSSPKKLAEKDDILISVRAPVGPTNLCPEKSCIGRGLAALRPKNMPTKYFLHYLRYIEKEWDSKATGTTFKAITGDVLRNQEIPLAPLPEQERIVNRIEELLSDLDAGVASLERVQMGLQRYRASVLKVACEGKLFGDVELGEEGLPMGWRWTTVGEIGKISGGLTKNSKRDALKKKMPYLRVANVYANELQLDDVSEIGVEEKEIKRALLQDGDLLVVEGNGSPDQIGRVAIWNGSISPCLHQNHIIKVRFEPKEVAEYVLYWLLSESGREQITKVASSTSGLYTLSLSKVSNLPVPLPPLDEQRRIVAEVEWRLSVVGEVESAVEVGLVRAGRLRQSVLRSAFEGRL